MSSQSQAEQLVESLRDLHSLLDCRSLDQLLEQSVKLVRQRVGGQVSSIFLFSKAGLLERRALDGQNQRGDTLSSDWYKDERYQPGEGFTGGVVSAPDSPSLGEARLTNDLNGENLKPESRAQYLETFGRLDCAAAVPLRGQGKTYGVLEVVNKAVLGEDIAGSRSFSDSDVYWLTLIGVAASSGITVLRGYDRESLLSHISQMITRPLLQDEDPQSTYQNIAEDLTGPLSPYKACVIRIGASIETLEVLATAGNEVTWDNRQEALEACRSIYLKVFTSGKPELIQDIRSQLSAFAHPQWVIDNSLKSYACFPLVVRQRGVGTLSLYSGHSMFFDVSEEAFIANVAFLLASLSEAFHAVGAISLEEQQTSEEQARNLSGSRAVSHDHIVTELRHDQKRFLVALKGSLEGVLDDVSGQAKKALGEQIRIISGQVNSILDGFTSRSHSAVNVNHVVKAVVSSYSRELKWKRIRCEVSLGLNIPDIQASELEIRDVVVNLLTNAIRAIEQARKSQGIIVVTTGLSQHNRREVLEIAVEDNGVGIRNEFKDEIFKFGFTQYKDGSGIGLYVTNGIVEGYDGDIQVDTALGKGTKFSVKLPLKRLRVS